MYDVCSGTVLGVATVVAEHLQGSQILGSAPFWVAHGVTAFATI